MIIQALLEIYGIARTPPVSAVPTETPIYGYLKVPEIPSIKCELVVSATNGWPYYPTHSLYLLCQLGYWGLIGI